MRSRASKVHKTALIRGSDIAAGVEVREYCTLHEARLATGVVLLERVSVRRSTFAARSFANVGCVIENTTIEEDVQIGANCTLPGVWHEFDELSVSKKDVWTRITLKKNCLLGAGTIVTPGVTIGVGAVTGAGSIVTKDIPDHYIYWGTPPNHTCMPISEYLVRKGK